MNLVTRLVLIALYPLLLIGRLASVLSGHDPLRRKEPSGSCWIERPHASPARSYFDEADSAVTGTTAGAAIRVVARAFAPPDDGEQRKPAATASLPSDIPDEVYTLW